MNWLETILRCFDEDRILYSGHARREMRNEEFGPIADREVYEAIRAGEVIARYLDDRPYPSVLIFYPSVLIFGQTDVNRPLHVVCAYDSESDRAIIVTVYQPHPDLWENYRRRRR